MNDTQAAPAPVQTLDTVAVQKAIPHRYPFLLVDRVDIVEPSKKAVGYKAVTINEPFFNGHFPGHPIMPGVLIVEALAQTACVLMMQNPGFENKIAYFLAIDEAKFRQAVRPGSMLQLKIEILRAGSRAGRLRGEAYLDGGALAAEANMSFAIVDKEKKG